MEKKAYYFSHDASARNDERVLEMRAKIGWEGYGVYWAIVELLRESTNYEYHREAIAGLSVALGVSMDKLTEMLKVFFETGLFKENDTHFYSDTLKRRMKKYDDYILNSRIEGRKGAEKRWGTHSPPIVKLKPPNRGAVASKGKDSIIKDTRETCIRDLFVSLKGFDLKHLFKEDYARMGKAIKGLLAKSGGNADLVCEGLNWIKTQPYSWTLETLNKKWVDFMSQKGAKKYL